MKRARAPVKLNRACMLCGIVQPLQVFRNDGCPNCESVLHFQDNDAVVRECTSPSFEGLLARGEGDESWAARWLRIDGFVPGLYAVRIAGKLPDDVRQELESQGVYYRPRDGSVQD